jgi:hypothetical protein
MFFKREYFYPSILGLFLLYENRSRIYYGYKWLKFWGVVMLGGGPVVKAIELTDDEIFVKKQKGVFMSKLGVTDVNDEVVVSDVLNENMLKIYYDKDELNENMQIMGGSRYEHEWKKRSILIVTPYGNVGMNYDLYHRGFSYYSDVKNIPYVVLNCVAMYYVIKFRCLDFYYDNTIMKNWVSPIWIIWDKDTVIKNAKPFLERIENVPTKSLTVKLKNYRLDYGKDEKGNDNVIYNKNRFLYCGKVTDMFLMFKRPKKKLDMAIKKMSFAEYKKLVSVSQLEDDSVVGSVGDMFD